jgi:hypothetical protein
MQGIYVDYERPKSKKAVKEAIADDPARVYIEATSLFGNEYNGPLPGLKDFNGDRTVSFVGPDPYTKRNFYGTITVSANGSVKCS